MKNFLFIVLLFANFISGFSQEYLPFEGKMVYQVQLSDSVDSKPHQSKFVTIYTNDTLVRVESESNQLGSQVMIKHLTLNKYYILLELNNQKFAIQHLVENDTTASKYSFENKRKKKKILGKKAKKTIVSFANSLNSPKTAMYYYPEYSPKYLDALKGISGLPVDYYLFTEEGVYHYKLIEFKAEKVNRDIFGIPKDYKKVSFDEFLNAVMDNNPQK